MGHKFFSIGIRNQPACEHRFGELVNLGGGEFCSVHTSMQDRRCSYCGRSILNGQPYLRLHAVRSPDAPHHPIVDRRCCYCIGFGILPSAIRSIRIFGRYADTVAPELTTVEWSVEKRR